MPIYQEQRSRQSVRDPSTEADGSSRAHIVSKPNIQRVLTRSITVPAAMSLIAAACDISRSVRPPMRQMPIPNRTPSARSALGRMPLRHLRSGSASAAHRTLATGHLWRFRSTSTRHRSLRRFEHRFSSGCNSVSVMGDRSGSAPVQRFWGTADDSQPRAHRGCGCVDQGAIRAGRAKRISGSAPHRRRLYAKDRWARSRASMLHSGSSSRGATPDALYARRTIHLCERGGADDASADCRHGCDHSACEP